MARATLRSALLPAVLFGCGWLVRYLLVWQEGTNVDSGVFLAMAHWMGKGLVPYRELVDHKPPGIEFLILGSMRLVGPGLDAIRGVYVTLLMLTLAPIYVMGKRLGGRGAGLWAGLLFALTPLALNLRCLTLTQLPLATLFTATGAALFVEALFRRRGVLAAAAGAAAGAGFAVKQPAGLTLVTLGAYCGWLWWRRRGRFREAGGWRLYGFLWLGFVASQGVFLVYLLANGILGEYWRYVFEVNRPGGLAVSAGRLRFQWQLLADQLPFLLGLGGAAVIGYRLARRRGKGGGGGIGPEEVGVLAMTAFGVEWLFTQATPYFFHHYFYPLIPWMCLLGGAAVEWVTGLERREEVLRARWMRRELPRAALLAFCVLQYGTRQGPLIDWFAGKCRLLLPGYAKAGGHPEEVRIAELVRGMTGEGDRIQVFGNSVYYYLADRRPASRFFYYGRVLRESAMGEEYAGELRRTLEEGEAKLVLVAEEAAEDPGLREILAVLPEGYRRVGSFAASYQGELGFWMRKGAVASPTGFEPVLQP